MIEDKRLTLLRGGQYRIHRDSQSILVPKGKSTTKPLTNELVLANVEVDGEIEHGYFQPLKYTFSNTMSYKQKFDQFFLETFRRELPDDVNLIDIGITNIVLDIESRFVNYNTLSTSIYNKLVNLHFNGDLYISDQLFTVKEYLNSNNFFKIKFSMVASYDDLIVPAYMISFNRGNFGDLKIYIIIEEMELVVGMQTYPILPHNDWLANSIDVTLDFMVIGGYSR